jgi:hypothetical protein
LPFVDASTWRAVVGVIEDMLNALDRVEWWKELRGTPQRITDLEKRVAELEQKLGVFCWDLCEVNRNHSHCPNCDAVSWIYHCLGSSRFREAEVSAALT